MGHHVVDCEPVFFSEEDNAPLQPGTAFEQVFAQPSDPQIGVEVRISETLAKGVQRRGDPLPIIVENFATRF